MSTPARQTPGDNPTGLGLPARPQAPLVATSAGVYQPGHPNEASAVAQYWNAIRRNWWRILTAVVLITALTAVYEVRQPKEYEAHAMIRIDPTGQQNLVGGDVQRPQVEVSTLISTEATEVRSPAVTLPVIQKFHLEHEDAFGFRPAPSDDAHRIGGVPQRLLDQFLHDLSVVRPPDTYLLDIGFRTRSPQLSAEVANELAQGLLAHEYETRSQALLASSKYLTAQSDDLRAKMEKSQLALADFERGNNIVNPDGKTTLLAQQLSDISQDLDKKQAQQRQLQGQLTNVESHDLNALLVSDRGEQLKPLLDAVHQEEIHFDHVAATYGPGDYLYRDAERSLTQVKATLDEALQQIADQVKAEAAAQDVETQLTLKAYNDKKQELDDFNGKAAEYNVLKQQAESESKLYNDLLQKIEDANVSAGFQSGDLRYAVPAQPNPEPVAPRVMLTTGLVGLLSACLAVALTLVLINLDRTLSSPQDVQLRVGERLLGSVPQERSSDAIVGFWAPRVGLPAASTPRRSSYAESVLTLRTALLLGQSGTCGALALTSAQPREGKTTTSVSLAVASAYNGVRTVLVDCDIRRPSVHRMLSLSNRVGLSSYLQGESRLEEALVPGPVEGLTIMTAGPSAPNSSELLTAHFGRLLEELRARFDFVVMDCPPVLGFADAMIVGAAADLVAVVVRAGETPFDYVRATVEQLRAVRANIAGVILNGTDPTLNNYYGYYSYYRDYYRAEDDEET